MQKIPSINLAKGRNESFIDRFMNWALSVGRGVVIVTEAIALATFLMRFSYDKQIIDLHDKIKTEQAIVKAYADQEATYRNLQNRLDTIEKYEKQAPQVVAFAKQIVASATNEMSLSEIQITTDTLKIDATFHSTGALATFIKTLQENPHIATVNLDRVENKTLTAVIATSITAKLKQ